MVQSIETGEWRYLLPEEKEKALVIKKDKALVLKLHRIRPVLLDRSGRMCAPTGVHLVRTLADVELT